MKNIIRLNEEMPVDKIDYIIIRYGIMICF